MLKTNVGRYENLLLNPSCPAKSGKVAYRTGQKLPKGDKKMSIVYHRHGELLIKSVLPGMEKFISDLGKAKKGDNSSNGPSVKKLGHSILAKGEATGHKHEIVEGDIELFEIEGTLYLRVKSEEAKLAHPEHKTIAIQKGTYEIDHQREYVPSGDYKKERRVWD